MLQPCQSSFDQARVQMAMPILQRTFLLSEIRPSMLGS